jgi:dihydrofolate reductase
VQGRKTWDSLPPKSKPLTGRINIVISTNSDLVLPAGTLLAADFESAVKTARQIPFHHQIFIIGGQSIYAAALATGEVGYISATRVDMFSRADVCVLLFCWNC